MGHSNDVEREFAREHRLPVEKILGQRTVRVVRALHAASAAILKRPKDPRHRRFPDYERLTPWRTLTESQLSRLGEILTDPNSYWTGWPKYRRFPPRPGFAVELRAADDEATVLVDLHNPGWELYCHDETYWGFNFAGSALKALAKSIYPEYASERVAFVWKKGAVEALENNPS